MSNAFIIYKDHVYMNFEVPLCLKLYKATYHLNALALYYFKFTILTNFFLLFFLLSFNNQGENPADLWGTE